MKKTLLGLAKLLGFARRVPLRQQMADLDCGPACLTMVLGYYDSAITVSQVRQLCEQVGPAQSTTTLIKTARQLGLRASLVAMDIPHPSHLELPAILHWEFNHFVVLDGITKKGFQIVDPAIGRRSISLQEFGNAFTGIAIALTPSDEYQPTHRSGRTNFEKFLLSTLNTSVFRRAVGLVLLYSVFIQGLSLLYPYFSLYLVDVVIPFSQARIMPLLLLLIGLFAINQTIISWLRARAIASLQQRADHALLAGFVAKMLTLPVGFFLERSVGDITSRANSNTVLREALSNAVLAATLDSVLILLNLGTLFYLNPAFALATCGLAALQLGSYVLYARALYDPIAAESKTLSSYQSYLNEVLSGIVTVKANAAEKPVTRRWENKLAHYLVKSAERSRVDAWHAAIAAGLRLAIPALLLWYSVSAYLAQQSSLGELLALNAIAAMVFGPISGLVTLVRNLQYFRAHGERLGEMWEHGGEQEGPDRIPPRPNVDISVRQLNFRYKTARVNSLTDCNLVIPYGKRCAVVGPSGSGKSTLISLLLSFHEPTAGSIHYGDDDLRSLDLTALRSSIGYVSQQNFLFNGSIRSNIALSRPDASMDEIEQAAAAACILETIRAMPLGFDTVVGEGGANLSGGQRQRIAIARAVLSKPQLLILDEATSNLDAETEAQVVDALARLAPTQIWVTHRLSSLKHCDLIYIMEAGSVIASGSASELSTSNTFFKTWLQRELSSDLGV